MRPGRSIKAWVVLSIFIFGAIYSSAAVTWQASPKQSFKVGFPAGTGSVTLEPGTAYPIIWEKQDEWYITVNLDGKARNLLVSKTSGATTRDNELVVAKPLKIDASQQYAILRKEEQYPVIERSEDKISIELPDDSPLRTCAFPKKYFSLIAIMVSEDSLAPSESGDALKQQHDALKKQHAHDLILKADKPEDYVLLIIGDAGSGTGFLMREGDNVYCYTAFHVIDGLKGMQIFKMSGEELTPLTLEVSNRRDIARMLIGGIDKALPGFREAKIGEELTVYGNSQGRYRITELKGKVTGVGNNEIETNAEFTSGNSGSALVAKSDGYAIGVASYIESSASPDDLSVRGTQFAKPRRVSEALDDRIDWINADPRRLISANRKYQENKEFIGQCLYVMLRIVGNPYKPVSDLNISDLGLKRWISNYNRRIQQARKGVSDYENSPEGVQEFASDLLVLYKEEMERFTRLCNAREAQIRAMRFYPGTHFQNEQNQRMLYEMEALNEINENFVRRLQTLASGN